ncbi:hypothetical protein D3C86_1335210 [compost metagenome]
MLTRHVLDDMAGVDAVKRLLELSDRLRIRDLSLQSPILTRGDHVRVEVDPQTLDAPFAQQLEEGPWPAPNIQNPLAALEGVGIRCQPASVSVLVTFHMVKAKLLATRGLGGSR